jgi:hypothetical protein
VPAQKYVALAEKLIVSKIQAYSERRILSIRAKVIKILARPERFELPTPRFVVWCSIQLSYGRGARHGKMAVCGAAIAIGSLAYWQALANGTS